MTIPLDHILAQAQHRPPGYVEDVMSRGQVTGPNLHLDDQAYLDLLAKYGSKSADGCCAGQALTSAPQSSHTPSRS